MEEVSNLDPFFHMKCVVGMLSESKDKKEAIGQVKIRTNVKNGVCALKSEWNGND
jgi:hypothetical protein